MRKPAICICEKNDADQLRGCTAWFVLDLVGNPEDRFSHNEAHNKDQQHPDKVVINNYTDKILINLHILTFASP